MNSMWVARKKGSGRGRSRARSLSRAAAEQRGGGIGRIRLRRARKCSAEKPSAFLPRSRGAHGDRSHLTPARLRRAAGPRPSVIAIRSDGEERRLGTSARGHATRSKTSLAPPCSYAGCGPLQGRHPATTLSTTTSTKSTSASNGVDHRPVASSTAASSSRRWPSAPALDHFIIKPSISANLAKLGE